MSCEYETHLVANSSIQKKKPGPWSDRKKAPSKTVLILYGSYNQVLTVTEALPKVKFFKDTESIANAIVTFYSFLLCFLWDSL